MSRFGIVLGVILKQKTEQVVRGAEQLDSCEVPPPVNSFVLNVVTGGFITVVYLVVVVVVNPRTVLRSRVRDEV